MTEPRTAIGTLRKAERLIKSLYPLTYSDGDEIPEDNPEYAVPLREALERLGKARGAMQEAADDHRQAMKDSCW